MRQLFAWIILAASWLSPSAAAPAPSKDDLSAQVGGIVSELTRITGLDARKKVRCDRIPRAQVQTFLEQRLRESVKPAEIEAEEAALKKFGFAPPDFDLKRATLDLLAEQAEAFYDFHKKKLFIIGEHAGPEERYVLVHELAHALADQHFHLEKFISHGNQNDDSSLARLAVMEGQATWLMSEYVAQKTGNSLKDSPGLVEALSKATAASGQFPVFERAPLYLQQTLLFPYAQGLLFQQALVEKMDKQAFSEVFRRPPESTQQVLHPAKYFEHEKPLKPALPKFPSQRQYKAFTDGEMGELDNSILLRQYAGEKEAAAVAPEWKGGYFRLFAPKDHPRDWRRMVLAYASEWSSPEHARKFFDLYQKVLAGKWRTFDVTSRSMDTVAGRGDDGYFRLSVDGTRVTSLEGLTTP